MQDTYKNADEAYTQTLPLFRSTMKKFHRTYRHHALPLDEIHSAALVLWVEAWNTWDPDKGPFPKRLRFKLWYGLHSVFHKKMWRYEPNTSDGDLVTARSLSFQEGRLAAASPDARLLLEKAINTGVGRPDTRRNWLVEMLLDMGWAGDRILESFAEVRDLLGE